MADADRRQSVSEPYVDMEVFCPKEYTGTRLGPGAFSHTRAAPQLTPLSSILYTGTRGR